MISEERIVEGIKIWKYDNSGVHIRMVWLFDQLKEIFDFDVFLYDARDNNLVVTGNYPKERGIEIKKFFYDNYPIIETISLHKFGINIKFKTKVIY